MEENVPLDSTKKKQFLRSIKGIKKLIKKNDKKEVAEKPVIEDETKKKKTKKFVKQERGLVYLSHIPHGFYEHQMTEYFKQFGAVTNVRVVKSKRTGRSKGFAFVEFREPSVAQIVAETMNNYLMGKRLLKAAYIPPEKQRRHARRKNWNEVNNPSAVARLKQKKQFNAIKDENEELKRARKLLNNLHRTKAKLSDLGINYDFFAPVDVPLELIKIKVEKEAEKVPVKEETEEKPTKQEKKEKNKDNNEKKVVKDKKEGKKTEPVKTEKNVKPKVESKVKKDKIQKVDKVEQEEKQKKLDKAGVKDVKNFIKVPVSDDESDSSVDFDSDEYEKMMGDESDVDSDQSDESGDESDGDDDDGDDDGDDDVDDEDIDDSESGEESVVDHPPVKPKGKVPRVLAPKQNDKPQKQDEQKNKSAQVKRKAPPKPPVATKKPKFEKQNKPIPVKKQFKKKK